jgi:hypothetical protein
MDSLKEKPKHHFTQPDFMAWLLSRPFTLRTTLTPEACVSAIQQLHGKTNSNNKQLLEVEFQQKIDAHSFKLAQVTTSKRGQTWEEGALRGEISQPENMNITLIQGRIYPLDFERHLIPMLVLAGLLALMLYGFRFAPVFVCMFAFPTLFGLASMLRNFLERNRLVDTLEAQLRWTEGTM